MKINFIALIIISYSLLNCCFGGRDRLPDVYFHTPIKKKPVEYKAKIPAAAKKRLYSRLPKLINPSILLICPNSYEFKAVYEALKDKYELKTCKKIKDYIFGNSNPFDKNLKDLQVEEIEPLYFFKINSVKFCLALCGQRTDETHTFSSNFKNTFKNLNTVILYGICGCSDTSINVGSIIFPSEYIKADSLTTGHPDKDTEVFLKNEGFYFKTSKRISIERKLTKKIKNIQKLFKECYSLETQRYPNFSSDAFIKDDKFIQQITNALNTNSICINTEDYTIALVFNDVDFIPIRAVSDYAGLEYTNGIQEGKTQACEALSEAASFTFDLFAKKKLK